MDCQHLETILLSSHGLPGVQCWRLIWRQAADSANVLTVATVHRVRMLCRCRVKCRSCPQTAGWCRCRCRHEIAAGHCGFFQSHRHGGDGRTSLFDDLKCRIFTGIGGFAGLCRHFVELVSEVAESVRSATLVSETCCIRRLLHSRLLGNHTESDFLPSYSSPVRLASRSKAASQTSSLAMSTWPAIASTGSRRSRHSSSQGIAGSLVATW